MFAMCHCNLNTDSLGKFILYVCVCAYLFLWTHAPAYMVYSSMEVGVCAEAYQGGEPLRHINSAFMTFEVLDCDRKPKTLPRIRPEPVVSFTAWNPTIYSIRFSHKKKKSTFSAPKSASFCEDFSMRFSGVLQDGKRRYQEAVARKKIRLDRLGSLLKPSFCSLCSLQIYQRADVFYCRQYACCCQCKSLCICKKYAVFSLSWTNSMSSTWSGSSPTFVFLPSSSHLVHTSKPEAKYSNTESTQT